MPARLSPSSDSAPSSESSASRQELGLEAVTLLMQPLAKLMISQGIGLATALETLKQALVEQAASSFTDDSRVSNDSRISVLTGVHRKDVRRLRSARSSDASLNKLDPMISLAAQVVAQWLSAPGYQVAKGKLKGQPIVLPRTARYAREGEPHFAALVARVSSDVGARAVLDDLLRLGVVQAQGETHVALTQHAFVPQHDVRDRLHFLAMNASDHLNTAVDNLLGQSPLSLEQSAFSQGLSVEQVEQLHALCRRLWQDALAQFLHAATLAEKNRPALPVMGTSDELAGQYRVRFGAYFHHAPLSKDKLPSTAPPTQQKTKQKTTQKGKRP